MFVINFDCFVCCCYKTLQMTTDTNGKQNEALPSENDQSLYSLILKFIDQVVYYSGHMFFMK